MFSNEIHTILFSNVIFFLLLNANPELLWQILNKNISQNFYLSVLFLDLKFCQNLGFFLSEHCEWGTWTRWLPFSMWSVWGPLHTMLFWPYFSVFKFSCFASFVSYSTLIFFPLCFIQTAQFIKLWKHENT
jgi:hypothetical protein